MDSKYNTISFCREDYKKTDTENFSKTYVDEDEMYKDIGDFIRIAIKNGYHLVVHFDGLTIMVEYNYQDLSLSGGVSIEWLGDDEYIERYETDGKDSN